MINTGCFVFISSVMSISFLATKMNENKLDSQKTYSIALLWCICSIMITLLIFNFSKGIDEHQGNFASGFLMYFICTFGLLVSSYFVSNA